MKKAYTSPVAKLFDISAEEKIAANCVVEHYNLTLGECPLTANAGNCITMTNMGS